jgi:hypothetical protein
METVRFDFAECAVTGEPGLIIQGLDSVDNYYACTGGALVAHDVCEHQNGPAYIGDVLDEFEALGALLYTRGYEFPDVANDVATVLRDAIGLEYDYPETLEPIAMHPESHYGITTSLERGLALAVEEIRGELRSAPDSERDYYAQQLARVRRCARSARHSMTLGYLKACAKYPNRHTAHAAFHAVFSAVDQYAKHAADYIGDVLVLHWDASTARAHCELLSESEPEYSVND